MRIVSTRILSTVDIGRLPRLGTMGILDTLPKLGQGAPKGWGPRNHSFHCDERDL